MTSPDTKGVGSVEALTTAANSAHYADNRPANAPTARVTPTDPCSVCSKDLLFHCQPHTLSARHSTPPQLCHTGAANAYATIQAMKKLTTPQGSYATTVAAAMDQ